MITVNYNGDLIQSANMKQQAEARAIKYNNEKRCVYGMHEINCDTWVNYCLQRPEIQRISDFGRCSFQRDGRCACYRARIKAGCQVKTFHISGRDYRNVSSSAHWLIKNNPAFKVVFFTLTFPPTLKKHKLTKSFIIDEKANYYLSKFFDNFKKTYSCNGYIAVKERGKKNGRIHFHILASFPYFNFMHINNSWCECIKDFCNYSNCAVQTDSRYSAIIKNPFQAVRYVCKYFSKAKRENGTGYTRLIFVSRNLLNKKDRITDISPAEILCGYKGVYIKTMEYATLLRVTNKKSFKEYCEQFVYCLFDQKMNEAQQKYRKKETEFILKTLNRKHRKFSNRTRKTQKKTEKTQKNTEKYRPRIYRPLEF